MRLSLLALLLVVSTSVVFANDAIIKLKVRNAPFQTEAQLTQYLDQVSQEKITLSAAVLDESGLQTLAFRVDRAQTARLKVAQFDIDLYLEPSMDLTVEFDFLGIDSTLRFIGTTAKNQEYFLHERLSNIKSEQTKYTLFDDASTYSKFIDSVQNAHLELFASSDTATMTAPFREYMRMAIACQYHYPRDLFKIVFNQETQQFTGRDVPDWYDDKLKALNVGQDKFAHESVYVLAVQVYLQNLVQGSRSSVVEQYNSIKNALNGEVRNVMLGRYLRRSIPTLIKDFSVGDSLMEDFKLVAHSNKYYTIVNDLYTNAKMVAPGMPAPNIAAYDADGNYRTLSEFKGKVVYIDIWATWCLPCIAAMKSAKELRDEMRGSDVVFLYINWKDDQLSWKNFSESKDMGSHNWFADATQGEYIKKTFDVRGIPRYILIDREGKIFSAEAPGPDRVKNLLEKVLQE